jgi:Transposase/Helix-turn-helix domain of transposase family ISL3
MHFTKEFEAFALLLLREMPVSKVAEIVGETDPRLWRMLFRQVDAAYAEADFSHACCVGVDEMSVRKGHEYVSVFADLVRQRVLFATEGKDHSVWLKFVEALEKHHGHRHSITQASMDMSPAYQKGVRETCRNAQVVFDKFHVVMNVNKAVDQVRRAGRVGRVAQEPVVMAQEPGEPHGEGSGATGGDRPEKFAHRQGVSDATGVTGYLPESDRDGGGSPVSSVVSLGALGGAQAAQEYAALDGQGGGDGGAASGRNFSALEMGRDQRLHGRTQQCVQCHQTQSPWLPLHHSPDHHALFRGRQTPSPSVLIPPKTAKNRSSEDSFLPVCLGPPAGET